MEKFLIPKNKFEFIKWLFQNSINNGWTIAFEYSENDLYNFLIENSTQVALPRSCEHYYDGKCQLTAIINPVISNNFIGKIISDFHVMSIHDNQKMIFLIADDIHEECFSGSTDFYEKYYQILNDNQLIDIHWRP